MPHRPCSQTCTRTEGHAWKHANMHGHAYSHTCGQAAHTGGTKHRPTNKGHTHTTHMYVQKRTLQSSPHTHPNTHPYGTRTHTI